MKNRNITCDLSYIWTTLSDMFVTPEYATEMTLDDFQGKIRKGHDTSIRVSCDGHSGKVSCHARISVL